MEIFVQVVEQGGFSQAGRKTGLTPSAVSKLISRLEDRIGARLFNRSTRRLELTPEGCVYYERATKILADIDDAESRTRIGQQPAGLIRVTTSASYANHVLIPLLPDFLALYPEIRIDLAQTDLVIDLLAERTDVAIRTGPLKSSSLVARKLGQTQLVIVASPHYLERFGTPQSPADLASHIRIGFGYARSMGGWPLLVEGQKTVISTGDRVQAGDGEAMRNMALAGVGLARLTAFTVREDIAAGRLLRVLEHLDTEDYETFYAVYAGQGGPLPLRVRVLLDFLAERGRIP